jgi:cyclopropane-fatty-acyl-phospholipid synthase
MMIGFSPIMVSQWSERMSPRAARFSSAEHALRATHKRPVSGAKEVVAGWLRHADIQINGSRPWDIQVHDERLWNAILGEGSLGVGEAYMNGWFDAERLDELLFHAIRASIDTRLPSMREVLLALKSRLINLQTPSRSFKVGEQHYDVGDDLYTLMLDPRLIYSCGYWKNAPNLAMAQEAKLDLICRKLGLKPGMRVLDIGCGWGGAAQFAAERYGVEVTGVTISKNQAASARERCQHLPVNIIFDDYRSVQGTYDRIYSIGMFEHVGDRNHGVFFDTTRRLLASDGLMLLHTIGNRQTQKANDPWIEKYIFPHSKIPSRRQIDSASEGIWTIEDWHEFGVDYDRTLMAWSDNFERAWPKLKDRYGERFHRMWHFYLMSSAASFRSRNNQLWQVVMSPEGIVGGYQEVR